MERVSFMHFLLTCKTLDNVRNPFLSKIYSKNKNISKLDNKSLFIWLMGNEDKNILIIICQLLRGFKYKQKYNIKLDFSI